MSFLITTRDQLRIYAAGDTSIFYDLQLFGQLYRPHIGLIPVGGFPGYFTELSPSEAALAANWLCLHTAIPIHYPAKENNGEVYEEVNGGSESNGSNGSNDETCWLKQSELTGKSESLKIYFKHQGISLGRSLILNRLNRALN